MGATDQVEADMTYDLRRRQTKLFHHQVGGRVVLLAHTTHFNQTKLVKKKKEYLGVYVTPNWKPSVLATKAELNTKIKEHI